MNREVYRYRFEDRVPIEEARDSLMLAAFAAEGLHGCTQVQLDAAFAMSEGERVCVVDARSAVGLSLARIFTRFLTLQFGPDAFTVEKEHEDASFERDPMPQAEQSSIGAEDTIDRHRVPPACGDDWVRLPGLFRRWELEQVIELHHDYRFEGAGSAMDGTPLFAVYAHEPPREARMGGGSEGGVR